MTYDRQMYETYATIRKQLGDQLIGLESAKSRIAMVAAEHLGGVRLAEGEPRVLLLVGDTGAGKTELCRVLASVLSVPFTRVDATELTQTAFRGVQIGDIVSELVSVSRAKNKDEVTPPHGEPSQSAAGVILVDEFDKIAFVPSQRDQVQERHLFSVQAALLRLFEGKSIRLSDDRAGDTFDTSRLLILAAGAFNSPDIVKTVRERDPKKLDPLQGHWGLITHEDLIRFGIMPELVGRIRSIVPLPRIDSERFKEMFRRRLTSESMDVLGCKVNFHDEALDVLSQRASEKGLGGRAVGIILSELRLHVFEEANGIVIDRTNGIVTVTKQYTDIYWQDDI